MSFYDEQAFIKADAARFHDRYVKDPISGCWLWTGTVLSSGYGQIRAFGKRWRAHRLSWVLHNSEIPDELLVLHRCDNRCCVNPNHLFLGTSADNANDKVAKGRQARNRGEKAGGSRLSKAAVLEIFRSIDKPSCVASKFGITENHVTAIRRGERWRHVTEAVK